MAEAAITVATEEAVRPLLNSLATQFSYIWNYKTKFENLKRQHQKLKDTLAQVQHSVEEAESKGEEIEQKVVEWLNSAEKIIAEVTKIIDDNNMRCFKSLCPDLKKRYQHGKKAAVMGMEVSKLEIEGNSLGKVSYRTLSKEPWGQFLTDYRDFESRKSIVEDVLKALSNSDVYMVGVYGMGGAGKTTLARVVGKQADKVFDVVVFVEVSETPDVRNIQGAIAGKLGLELQAETETSVRANKLYEQLQIGRKNILLILDNIWEGCLEYLKKVGIPLGGDHRACKLLLTARGIDVLSTEMNCQTNFLVGDLNENDAWALFKKMAGACIEQHGLQPIASEVAKRCGGLPVAIVTVAKALKGKQEHAWRTALLELKRPSLGNKGSVTEKTYICIRLSYNQLNSDELKSTFLHCCNMRFTSDDSVEGLLRYGIGLNLFKTVCTMQEARDKVITLVQELKNSSLLLETFDDEQFSIHIHDVVRDVGRAIAINDQNNYTVNDDRILRDLAEENTLKNCTSITLHDVSELPEMLDCSNLKFLYIKPKARFSKIPDNFFKGMSNLGVLHLIEMVLSPLPVSFHLLKKLQTLYLDRCHLGDIAEIGNLNNLKILVLQSDMEWLPEQIGELTRLKVLDLSKCYDLRVIPPNTISRLTQLEELYMPNGFDQWQVEGVEGGRSNGSLGELEHLSQLTALQIYIPDAKLVPKGLLFQKLQRYKINIGVDGWRRYSDHNASTVLKMEYDDANISVEDGIIEQLKEIEELELIGNQGVKNVLYELNRDGFPKLKHFDVERNLELVYIVDFPKQSEPCVAFPHLRTLSLYRLSSLEKICQGQFSSPYSFCQLRNIRVRECVKLKNFFSSSIARHLSQLQRIEVTCCEDMEEIFSIVGGENEEIVLEKLDSLYLHYLPKLRSFSYEEEVGSTCDEERQMKDTLMPLFDGKVKFRNLKTIYLWGINLKYVFSSSTLGSFVQLQSLEIFNCGVLEEIIRIDDLKNNVELPSLKTLHIYQCPAMKSFICSDKVTFPSLEEIKISDMDNLEIIWQTQFEDSLILQCYPKLSKMTVTNCQSLKNLFPTSNARNLSQLKEIYVENCGINAFIFGDKVTFPSLVEIEISGMDNLEMIWQNQFDDSLNLQCYPKLSKMTVTDCQSLKNLFPASIARNLSQLKQLYVKNCGINAFIFGDKVCISLPQLEPCVAFPHLQTLSLEYLSSLEKICHGQFTPNSFCQLRTIRVERCVKLKSIFSSSIARHLSQLERIGVFDCKNMEEIFSIVSSENEEIVLDKLDSLGLSRLPKLRSFSYEEEGGSTCDEERQMKDSLMPLFDGKVKFPNLKAIYLREINLKYVFSSSTLGSFVQLQSLEIFDCGVLEEIIRIDDLKNNVELPSLKTLHIYQCPAMKSFIFSDKLIDGQVLPNLEELGLDGRKNSMVWQRPFQEIFFPKLKFLEFRNDKSTVLPPNVLQRSHNLERLLVENSSYEWIFSCEEIEEYAQIKSLYATRLGNLKQIWKQDSKVDTILQNLEKLVVRSCGSLVTLLPPSTSFQNLTVLTVHGCRLINLISSSTAKSLMQLKEMEIKDCNMMTEVVTGDGVGIEDEINFKNLKSLELVFLSRLRRFCSGNYNFNFPSLEILKVRICPKMRIFCSKATNTPMLREIQLDRGSYYCAGDVNKTMEWIHEKEVFSSDELTLSANEIRMTLQKFPEHKFSKVKTLKVFDDESTVFPLDILQRFQNLNYVKLSYTSYKEIFSCEDVEKHAETLAQIKRLRLKKLDDLEQMWKQDSRSDLILHNLEYLEVVECNSLITLVPTSASFQNLRSMSISACNGLRSLVTATVSKSLVQLWRLQISNCNEMAEIVANGDAKEDGIIFNKLERLKLVDLSNLTCFYSGNYTLNFPSLTNLKVTCPKMKFFSSGISSTPMLQQIEWGSSEYNLEVDLNTTIQRIHEEMNVENSTEDCAGPSTQHLE